MLGLPWQQYLHKMPPSADAPETGTDAVAGSVLQTKLQSRAKVRVDHPNGSVFAFGLHVVCCRVFSILNFKLLSVWQCQNHIV